MFEYIINILFPVNCVICDTGLALDNFYAICPDCMKNIEKINSYGCVSCGRPLGEQGLSCAECIGKKTYIDSFHIACLYKENIKKIIIDFKFNSKIYLKKILGHLLVDLYNSTVSGEYDLIVPIPLSNARKHARSYNQSELISVILSKQTNIPLSRALKRKVNTKQQSSLKKIDRLKNVHGVFRGNKIFMGKTVLLIDDIATTGATVQSAAKELKACGALKVSVLVLAHGQ